MPKREKKQPVDDGFRISDAFWERIEPLIPKPTKVHPLGCHNPRIPDRVVMDGILLLLRTGMQWNALSKVGPCKSTTAHTRFSEWVEAGVFLEMWRLGLMEYDDAKGIDWEWLSMDGAMTKAPLGGEKNRPQSDRPRKGRRQTLCAV